MSIFRISLLSFLFSTMIGVPLSYGCDFQFDYLKRPDVDSFSTTIPAVKIFEKDGETHHLISRIVPLNAMVHNKLKTLADEKVAVCVSGTKAVVGSVKYFVYDVAAQ